MRQIDFALMRRVSASSLAPSFGFLLTVFCAVAMAPPVSAGPAEAVGSAEAGPAGAGVNHPGPAAVAGRGETADLASLRNDAIAAYNRQDYAQAASFAAGYVERARAEGRTGREFAAVLFILGHARYEEEAKRGLASAAEYRAQIVLPLEESLRILQDDAVFKNMLLGNAYYELWLRSGRRDTDAEGRAHWFLLKSILLREDAARDRAKDSPEYDLFARHLLFYLERCLDLARDSANPGIYIQRIRTAAPWGFTTAYDARFWQIYDLTYFDDANLQAGVLWQRGLDAMHDPKAEVDAVLATFGQAASRTRQRKARAEIYRQMADFLSTLDEPERRSQTAELARKAYELNPEDAEIRRLFGSALHLLSYGAYASGKFEEALRQAQDATHFEWDGMETAFFDLSRAAAEMGQETDALTQGERAYRMAKERTTGPALQPFAQNYVNILRQFGQDAMAARVLHDEAALGVR